MMVEGRHIYLYGEKKDSEALVIVNTFHGDGNELYTALKSMTDKKVCLAVISDIDWNKEMSPWACPSLGRNDEPCTGGADEYLNKLTQVIIPAISGEPENEAKRIIIAGYSLAGLFAVYSLYRSDVFTAAVSASGSMWFPDFKEFTDENEFRRIPDRVYFSLGDKESKSRHPLLATVEKKTGEIYAGYKASGIETIFEMNPGNHFKDADIRLSKGIAWVLK